MATVSHARCFPSQESVNCSLSHGAQDKSVASEIAFPCNALDLNMLHKVCQCSTITPLHLKQQTRHLSLFAPLTQTQAESVPAGKGPLGTDCILHYVSASDLHYCLCRFKRLCISPRLPAMLFHVDLLSAAHSKSPADHIMVNWATTAISESSCYHRQVWACLRWAKQ